MYSCNATSDYRPDVSKPEVGTEMETVTVADVKTLLTGIMAHPLPFGLRQYVSFAHGEHVAISVIKYTRGG